MFEKIAINNELLSMKKTIAQAKGCVIGKLIRKLRETNKKLEDVEVKPLKLSTRPAKLTDQIAYLKRTNNLELARLCLIASVAAQQVLTNPASSTDEQALAQLRSFKSVVERIGQIKEKYSLNETSEDWRSSIREVGKKKQKKKAMEAKIKRKEEKMKRETQDQKALTQRSEWLAENMDDEAVSASPQVRNENTNGSNELCVDANTENIKPILTSTKTTTKSKLQKKNKIESLPKVLAPIKKPVVQMPKAPEPPKRNLDSFFVTDSGTAYMATGFEERVQSFVPNDGMDRRERRARQFGKGGTQTKRPTPRLPTYQIKDKQTFSTLTKPNFIGRTPDIAPAAPTPPTNIHPSWAAKQNAKSSIATFQGRKMTFAEDGSDEVLVKNKPPTQSLPQVIRPKSKSEEDASKMHPSWLAKQKLKPVISAFQGKKITFDNN